MAKEIQLVSELTGKIQKSFENDGCEGEEIIAKLQPSSGEAIVVTDRRVIIIKAGIATGAGMFGARSKSFYFNQITSVDLRIGLTGGHLQVTVAGSTEKKDNTFTDMMQAENAVTFQGQFKDVMKKVAEIIRERIHLTQNAPAGSPNTNTKSDFIQELKELAELKREGLLSDEEFEQAKKKLLG